MKSSRILFLILPLLFSTVHAIDLRSVKSVDKFLEINTPEFLIKQPHQFHGLARVYNDVHPIYVKSQEVYYVNPDELFSIPKDADFVGWKSRYQVGMIQNKESLNLSFNQNKLIITSTTSNELNVLIGTPDQYEELSSIKYSYLWNWVRWIAMGLERVLINTQFVFSNWGLSIVFFSFLVKVLLFPVNQLTAASQIKVSRYQRELDPILRNIKKNHAGEEAHYRIMNAHKKLGITPFFNLKPMMLNLIQIPVLVAVFNMLGELAPLQGVSFLWINDLSLPDKVMTFPVSIPFMGDTLNLLPFFMTFVTLVSTVSFRNNIAPVAEVNRQKRNLYFMAVGFFILCYPFPSCMVLYWALTNFWQLLIQLVINYMNKIS